MNNFDLIKETLNIEANALLQANLDKKNIDKAIDIIKTTKSKLIVTGLGKSGHIASKISATFASTGTPSFFIHPAEALHGDLGMMDANDSLLAISYSGESEELNSIMPHIKSFKIPIIVMSSNINSTLSSYSDAFINIEVKKEACPLNIAPTSSTTLSLALGDALAICMMKVKKFKKENFALFHPGGSLGKRLYIKIKDLMQIENLPIVSKDTSLKESIAIMTEGRLGNLFICNNNKLEAVFSDGDLRRAFLREDFCIDDKIIKYANKNPLFIDNENILASDALEIIEENKIQVLVVVDENKKIKGALHIHKLIEIGIKK